MKKLFLVLVILLGMIIFAGCSIVFTTPDCCTPVTPPEARSSATIIAGPGVWGTAYALITSTGEIIEGEYLDYSTWKKETTFYNLPPGVKIEFFFIDPCNIPSHREFAVLKPGEHRIIFFHYW